MRIANRNPRRECGRRRGGFTMVELLVTMLLLSISLVGLAALQVQVVRGVTVSRRGDEATRLGQAVLERYLVASYDSIVAHASSWYTEKKRDQSSDMTAVGVDGEGAGPFTVQSLIENVDGTAKLITVKVSWQEHVTGTGARETSILFSTRRAKP